MLIVPVVRTQLVTQSFNSLNSHMLLVGNQLVAAKLRNVIKTENSR